GFLADGEVDPVVAASELPDAIFAAAVFDEEVARVAFEVRHAPRKPWSARDRKDRAAWQRGAHNVLVAPGEHRLVPDRRQPVHFQMRVRSQQRMPGGAALGRYSPSVAARQSR